MSESAESSPTEEEAASSSVTAVADIIDINSRAIACIEPAETKKKKNESDKVVVATPAAVEEEKEETRVDNADAVDDDVFIVIESSKGTMLHNKQTQTNPTEPRGIRCTELWERIDELTAEVQALTHQLRRAREQSSFTSKFPMSLELRQGIENLVSHSLEENKEEDDAEEELSVPNSSDSDSDSDGQEQVTLDRIAAFNASEDEEDDEKE